MLLIKQTLKDEEFSDDDCEGHKFKKPYVKKYVAAPASAAPPAPDSFMRDAHSGSTRRLNTVASSIAPEIKELNWFQRNVLCMKVDIHKAQYTAYHERHDMSRTQHLILHHVSRASGAPPEPTPPLAYTKWNTQQYPWIEVQRELYRAPAASSSTRAPADDDEDEEDYEEESGR